MREREGADVVARLAEHRGPAVERRPIEEPPATVGPALHDEQVVRREADRGEPLEVLLEARPAPSGFPSRNAVRPPASTRTSTRRSPPGPSKSPATVAPRGAEADELGEPDGPERLQRGEEEDRLEEVRLSLAVLADEHGRPRRRRELDRGEVPEVLEVEGEEPHRSRCRPPRVPRGVAPRGVRIRSASASRPP